MVQALHLFSLTEREREGEDMEERKTEGDEKETQTHLKSVHVYVTFYHIKPFNQTRTSTTEPHFHSVSVS